MYGKWVVLYGASASARILYVQACGYIRRVRNVDVDFQVEVEIENSVNVAVRLVVGGFVVIHCGTRVQLDCVAFR